MELLNASRVETDVPISQAAPMDAAVTAIYDGFISYSHASDRALAASLQVTVPPRLGDLDPGTAHDWVQTSRGRKPALDKDAMTDTLLRYKGAEAGEVDWRPTETIPEDFYAM